MSGLAPILYSLILSLWVGGIAIYSLLVTPIIFRSYPKDTAGDIVGKLFGPYFLYNLVLTTAALGLYPFVSGTLGNSPGFSLHLLIDSFLVALLHKFYVHPKARELKARIKSFENESQADPAILKSFKRLHLVSVLMNVFLLIAGIILLVVAAS